MPLAEIKLNIADTFIRLYSRFPLKKVRSGSQDYFSPERFRNFFYHGGMKPDISIAVEIVKELPVLKKTTNLFTTIHPESRSENWRLMKKDSVYIYTSLPQTRERVAYINKTFDRVRIFLLSQKDKEEAWHVPDIIYDFLQVLLINYFAMRGTGIFTHAVGVKDSDGNGLLFAGKSGNGKSTAARIWDKYSRAMVLNDDRIIVRKVKDKFYIYGSPWHGDFSDYLNSRIECALLQKLFFIYHASSNKAKEVFKAQAFAQLYPNVFPTFWDKESLNRIISFSWELVRAVPCFRLGLVKGKSTIKFIRGI